MTGNHNPAFRVGWVRKVQEQLEAITQHARDVGAIDDAAMALRAVANNLRYHPVDWGEALYRTKHASGVVRQAVIHGLSICFAAYEQSQIVLVLDVTPLSNHPWATG